MVVLSGLRQACYTENCTRFAVRGRSFPGFDKLALQRIVLDLLFVVVPFQASTGLPYGELCWICYSWSSFPGFDRLAIRRIVPDLLYVVVLSGLRQACYTENCARFAIRSRPFWASTGLQYRELC